jgi:dipeptidyl aminopeptidase/acylaminoacyl peptidase
VLWRHRGGPVRRLAWSADGRRLLIAGRRHGAVHTLATGATRALRLAPGEELTAAPNAPKGSRLALAVRGGGHTQVRLLGRRAVLEDAPRRLRSLEWSPDGRWLLAGWPARDQWLLIDGGGGQVVKAIDGVERRFGPGTRPLGWCCAPAASSRGAP